MGAKHFRLKKSLDFRPSLLLYPKRVKYLKNLMLLKHQLKLSYSLRLSIFQAKMAKVSHQTPKFKHLDQYLLDNQNLGLNWK